MIKKPHFVELTITFTYYGVGKTLQDAKQNALNEFANDNVNYIDLLQTKDIKQEMKTVKQSNTTIDKSYIDFVMSDNYEEVK